VLISFDLLTVHRGNNNYWSYHITVLSLRV